MRIRKNSRLVVGGSSTASSSSSPASFLVCQLNRSPWDVDSFSPQGEWDDSFALNACLGQPQPASDSIPSGESMELSFEYVEKKPAAAAVAVASKRGREGGEIIELEKKLNTMPFCGRVDGSGWHCQRLVKRGHTLCDHHLSQLNTKRLIVAPPALPPPPAPKRRGRPKKVDAAAAGNPYEFYYYSGFGPRWGKRRGGGESAKDVEDEDEDDDYGEVDHNLNGSMSDDDMDNTHYDKMKMKMKEKKKENVVLIENVVDEELDYIDDEDDEDANNGESYAQRRARKPIKARSLKSLM